MVPSSITCFRRRIAETDRIVNAVAATSFLARTVSISSWIPSGLSESGFSQSTWQPARAAASDCGM